MKFGHRRAEVPIQPVGRYRHPVLRVRGGLVAPLVPCPNAVLTHQPLHTRLAGWVSTSPQLPHHPGRTVGAFERLVDGLNQGVHLRIGEPLPLRRASRRGNRRC